MISGIKCKGKPSGKGERRGDKILSLSGETTI